MEKKRGVVKIFFKDKGYGFINSGEKDFYFDVKNIVGANLPNNGASVEFNETEGKKGPAAANVVILQNIKADSDDSRVICEHCKKKMVPRIVLHQGEPQHSVCPFCGGVYKKFPWPLSKKVALVAFIVVFLFLASRFIALISR
ncbi:MAG: cold shock domain-containing protein [Helicobacteraceae bacterium]|nr:cold shock domain-containing protein [Helicobacteraceae bacterium]